MTELFTSPNWPFFVLGIGILFVIVMIAVCRVHAFISLILAAILVGFLSGSLPGAETDGHFIKAIKLSMQEFGNTAGGIAWVIALAAIIGICLMESGAADRIVRQFVKSMGEKRAGWALMLSSFILSIPVFFDTVFFLLIPLAQALAFRLGRNYVYYIVAISAGGVITHSLVPPTPGPLIMIESLGLNIGEAIMIGIVLGLVPASICLQLGKFLQKKNDIPLRERPGMTFAELKTVAEKPESELPSFFLSILPVALPVLLIAAVSCITTMNLDEKMGALFGVIEVLGDKSIAMFLGTVIALYLLAKQKNISFRNLGETMGDPLSTAGVIILITAAGGAFGKMIGHAGIGEAIQNATEGTSFSFILLAWLVASIMKIAQGSSTVSMITTSGIMAAIIGDGSGLGYDPLYIYLAIGFGSMLVSWMNDSGFWIVCKMSGFTERETLKTWTVTLGSIAVIGIIEVLILSSIIPYPFGAPTP